LSMRPDLLPAEYCEELQKLRTEVAPMPEDEVERVIEASLEMKISEAFPTFDLTPLGSASIAQAHRATLPGGEEVVVKVQREGIHDVMASDIALLRKAAKLLKLTPTGETIDFTMVLDEMWVVSQQEMDFLNEAKNAEEFRRLNKDIVYVACPKVYHGLSTRQVLVMEAVDGIRIDDLPALQKEKYDPEEISRKLCFNYMKQVLDDGFFHADPHPGNLMIRDGQIVWLDLGMVGRLSAKDQGVFKKALSSAVAGDIGALTDAVLSISKHTAPVRRDALYADIDAMMNEYLKMDIGSMNLSELMQQVMNIAKKHGLAMPSGVTMLARGVSTLEGLVADISPQVNLMELLSQRFQSDALRNLDVKKALLDNSRAVYESLQKSLSTPALVNDALRAALKGELKLRLDNPGDQAARETELKQKEKIRHAALFSVGVIASAIMTLSPVEPRWFGMPWIAVLGFGCSAVYGAVSWWREKRGK
ncbi:MAG: AarF/UbiB family protein, partial [Eubacteriales bacterium]|nr:AarF/UbiB family protein [Eubacteriales bacterium]